MNGMEPGLADLGEVFRAHGVAVAYLFGSRAEGRARDGSDHDVAVLFAADHPAFDATERLAADLATRLGTPVDVVDLARAGLELRGTVAESGRLLFGADEPARVRPVVQETTRSFLRRVAQEGLR